MTADSPLRPSDLPTPGAGPAPWRARRTVLRGLLALLVALTGLWVSRAPILTAAARAFIVDEPLPARADAIVVLGGGLHLRPAGAARLYHAGLALKVLVTCPEETSATRLGAMEAEDVVAIRILEKLGVPSEAIERLPGTVASTYDEAVATRQWLDTHGGHTVIVPTNHFHTRRVNWIFERLFAGAYDARVTAIKPDRYELGNWWHSEYGVAEFQSELLKLLHYRITY